MGQPVAGEVVVVPFPQTDLVPGKKRPALVVAVLPGEDLILCQITGQAPRFGGGVPLVATDMAQGRLAVDSFIRPQRLFTVDRWVVQYVVGRVAPAKLSEVWSALRNLFS